MRHLLAALLLATCCEGAGSGDDARRIVSVLRDEVHSTVRGTRPTDRYRARLVHDVGAACLELIPGRWRCARAFILACACREGSATLDWHDSGAGWGRWAINRGEVEDACRRLGKPARGAWERFQHDQTFEVWIAVELYRWHFERNGWRTWDAALAHYKGRWNLRHQRDYMPLVLYWYKRFTGEHLPDVLAPEGAAR